MSEDTSFFFEYRDRKIHGVIFDMDGTLYNQRKMHLFMVYDLFTYYLIRPHRLHELRIIYLFRKKRYSLREVENLYETQYNAVADYLQIPSLEVKRVIEYWLESRPLRYIHHCKDTYIVSLFNELRTKKIKTGVVSDYPVTKKMDKLKLTADVMVCSTDKNVNSLKPSPRGFLLAAEKMGILPENCLVIGDRDDKDGEGARNANMLFIHVKDFQKSDLKEILQQ